MSMPLLVPFLIGAVSALAAILILVPYRALVPRPSRLYWGLSAAALALPAVLVLLVATAPAEDAPVLTAEAIQPPPPLANGMKQDADWALISHAFMGGPPPGSASAGTAPQPAMDRARMGVAELEEVTRREPRNVEAWLALAGAQRTARAFPEAVKAYESALELSKGNADVWADYADALATANERRLTGKPAAAIERALALDPRHLKALWLAASLDLQQKKYPSALKRWQELRAALPEGSPDIAIIDANIAEAQTLAGQVASVR